MSLINREELKILTEQKKIESLLQVGEEKHAKVKIIPKDKSYIVKVELFDSRHNRLLKKTQKTITNLKVVDATVETLIRSLEAEKKKTSDTKRGTYKDFAKRILDVDGVFDPKSYGIRRNGRYLATGTVHAAVTYTANTIGEMYEHFGTMDVSQEQQWEFFNLLIERIKNQDNKQGNSQKTREEIASGISNRWSYANQVLDYCRMQEPDGKWPTNPLITMDRIKVSSPELIKVLPYSRFIIAVRLLVLACKAGIQEAFAGAALVLRGLRVGESSAIKLGDIEYNGDIARYYICRQVGKKGMITESLKNDSSYRYVIMFGLMLDIIEIRKNQLAEKGYSIDEINESYLGSSYIDPKTPIDKTKVSAFLKKILIMSGCDDDELRYIEREIRGEKGDDCDYDLSAHLFRRNFATYALNGGMTLQMVDALLGHENKNNKKNDYAGWDNAQEIAGKLNRCFYFGSMTSSPNPSFSPVKIANMSVIAEGNREYCFFIENDGELTGAFNCLESDDSVEIIVDGCEVEIPIIVQTVADSSENRKKRMVLSQIPSADDIEQCIRKADEIWNRSELGGGIINEE